MSEQIGTMHGSWSHLIYPDYERTGGLAVDIGNGSSERETQ